MCIYTSFSVIQTVRNIHVYRKQHTDYFITTLYTCTNHSQWQEGLLLQLLQTSRGGGAVTGSSGDEGGRGGRWIVLDGALSAFQLDTLLTLFDVDKLIKLSNGRGIPIDSSCRFILEVCTCTYT